MNLSDGARHVYKILKYSSNSDRLPTQKKLSDVTGYSRKAVSKYLDELETAGYILQYKTSGLTTIYEVIPNAFNNF